MLFVEQKQILRDELLNDPLGLGYTELSDQEVTDLLNAEIHETWVPVPVESVKAWALLQLTPDGDFLVKALKRVAADDQHQYSGLADTILEAVGVNMPPWEMNLPRNLDLMNAAIAAGFLSEEQVEELRDKGKVMISRAQELGLPKIRVGWVTEVRSENTNDYESIIR